MMNRVLLACSAPRSGTRSTAETSSMSSPTCFRRRCSSSPSGFRSRTLRRWSTGCARSSSAWPGPTPPWRRGQRRPVRVLRGSRRGPPQQSTRSRTDMVTYFLQARIDGEPISRSTCCRSSSRSCWLGLDTTKSQLGFNFHHLATNPEDRAGWSQDPSGFRARSKRCFVCSPSCRRHASWRRHRVQGLPDEEGADGADAAVGSEP